MTEDLRKELAVRFAGGDWHAAEAWRTEALAERHPEVVAEAMEFLRRLASPAWLAEEVGARRFQHPLARSLCQGGCLTFWTAFAVGHNLAALRGEIPDVLRGRLLQVREFGGAEHELSAAALLARGGVGFDWYPEEGGEFRLQDDPIHYIEAKRPTYQSKQAFAELDLMNDLGRILRDAAGGRAVAYALRPDLAATMPRSRRRQLSAAALAPEFLDALTEMIRIGDVPGRRELPSGAVWIAHNDQEMRDMRAGGYSGLYLDNAHEAERVLRSNVKKAIRQLPAGHPSLIFMDWGAANAEFGSVVQRRLSRLTPADPMVTGVLLRTAGFTPADIVPQESAWWIENPPLAAFAAGSAALDALRADHLAALRAPSARHDTQTEL